MTAAAKIRIGISGWRYPPWRGVFYPPKLPQRRELEYASRAMSSIEINGSFYSLQRPSSWLSWKAETPKDFVFSVKAPRYITHILRLREAEAAIANFLASGLLALDAKLGPILWQFPPSLRYDEALFEAFLAGLPHDTQAALALAQRHEPRMKGRVHLEIDTKRPLRHAVEIRHASFEDARFINALRRHRVALVVADTAGKWPYLEDITADFMYLRLHGDEALYASGYTDDALERWASRIRAWRDGGQPEDAHLASGAPWPQRARRDIHCYFDNDIKVRAPFDASELRLRLGLEGPRAEVLGTMAPALLAAA